MDSIKQPPCANPIRMESSPSFFNYIRIVPGVNIYRPSEEEEEEEEEEKDNEESTFVHGGSHREIVAVNIVDQRDVLSQKVRELTKRIDAVKKRSSLPSSVESKKKNNASLSSFSFASDDVEFIQRVSKLKGQIDDDRKRVEHTIALKGMSEETRSVVHLYADTLTQLKQLRDDTLRCASPTTILMLDNNARSSITKRLDRLNPWRTFVWPTLNVDHSDIDCELAFARFLAACIDLAFIKAWIVKTESIVRVHIDMSLLSWYVEHVIVVFEPSKRSENESLFFDKCKKRFTLINNNNNNNNVSTNSSTTRLREECAEKLREMGKLVRIFEHDIPDAFDSLCKSCKENDHDHRQGMPSNEMTTMTTMTMTMTHARILKDCAVYASFLRTSIFAYRCALFYMRPIPIKEYRSSVIQLTKAVLALASHVYESEPSIRRETINAIVAEAYFLRKAFDPSVNDSTLFPLINMGDAIAFFNSFFDPQQQLYHEGVKHIVAVLTKVNHTTAKERIPIPLNRHYDTWMKTIIMPSIKDVALHPSLTTFSIVHSFATPTSIITTVSRPVNNNHDSTHAWALLGMRWYMNHFDIEKRDNKDTLFDHSVAIQTWNDCKDDVLKKCIDDLI